MTCEPISAWVPSVGAREYPGVDISALSKIIETTGGELQIVAKMPNGSVKIRQFTQIRQDESETATLR